MVVVIGFRGKNEVKGATGRHKTKELSADETLAQSTTSKPNAPLRINLKVIQSNILTSRRKAHPSAHGYRVGPPRYKHTPLLSVV